MAPPLTIPPSPPQKSPPYPRRAWHSAQVIICLDVSRSINKNFEYLGNTNDQLKEVFFLTGGNKKTNDILGHQKISYWIETTILRASELIQLGAESGRHQFELAKYLLTNNNPIEYIRTSTLDYGNHQLLIEQSIVN